jgi:hypothetical protein
MTCHHIGPHLEEQRRKGFMTLAQPFINVDSHVFTANIEGLMRVKIETEITEYDTEHFVHFILLLTYLLHGAESFL